MKKTVAAIPALLLFASCCLPAEPPPANQAEPEAAAPAQLVEMKVHAVVVDPDTEMPVVLLTTPDRQTVVPISIGDNEASAIWRYMHDVETPRPMTHDLLQSIIAKLGARLDHIEVTDLRDGVFYAEIVLTAGTEAAPQVIRIDARPSDSIALAVKTDCRIQVAQGVIDKAGQKPQDAAPAAPTEKRRTAPTDPI